ncbi:MAG: phosphoglucomutase/phosphomannomutase family protein [bacterium]|nr:phosphoglucomutase/phosphomannomutase family protein [bacterium]
MEIKFGTSGWRGIIADEFTFERARFVTAAIARYMVESGEARRGVLVGHDTRFMGEDFAADAARILSGMGLAVYLCAEPVPTPAVAYLILSRGLGGGVNFTASHNPSNYQGIKFSTSWGGPALPETTGRIEELVRQYREQGLPPRSPKPGRVETVDPAPEYLARLSSIVDLGLVARSGPPVFYDALYGTGAGYLDRVLEDAGCSVTTIHGNPDPLFGGAPPEPSEGRLAQLAGIVAENKGLGLSTDGDADRFGIVGSAGEFYPPNTVLALLADYLIRVKGVQGDLARSVATTGLLDTIAAAHGRRCYETPVGFKYIGQMISGDRLVMGGEESAGMSVRGHVPEKDGILACLLVAEMVAAAGRTLSELAAELADRYGPRFSKRVNLPLTEELVTGLRELLETPPREVGGQEARDLVTIDGTKWVFDDRTWVLLRLSGTEPVARLYVEADREERVADLTRAFRKWISGGTNG